MLDTVKIQSKSIPEELAVELEYKLERTLRLGPVDFETGERSELYSIHSGKVMDDRCLHGVNLRVMRSRIERTPKSDVILGHHTRSVECAPYLWLEGSVHKAMMGHNVWGGPRDLAPSVAWLCADVSRRLGLELPRYSSWELMRADWAETFDLGGFDQVQDYIRSLNASRFPRREAARSGDNSLGFYGRTTALRIYHKGPEFAGEGFRVLGRHFPAEEVRELQEMAHRMLRVEVAVRRPKITEHYPFKASVNNIDSVFLMGQYDREVRKVIREAKYDHKVVRTAQEVRGRLAWIYPGRDRLQRSLFSTWLQLTALGDNEVKNGMKARSYYYHRKQLEDAGIAWTGSDIRVLDTDMLPNSDFVPRIGDRRNTSTMAPQVAEIMRDYAAA